MIFLIYVLKNKITLYEYANSEFKIKKNNGEENTLFSNRSDFWKFWENKVQYQDEDVGFIILTDEDTFSIPDNINIITDIQILKEDLKDFIEIKNLIYKNIISYPSNFDINMDIEFLENSSSENIDKSIEENNSGRLREYFVKKTIEYDKNK